MARRPTPRGIWRYDYTKYVVLVLLLIALLISLHSAVRTSIAVDRPDDTYVRSYLR